MKRTRSGWWLIRPRMVENTQSLVAAAMLVLAGLFVRGPIGWTAVVLFGALAGVVVVRFARRAPVATLDPEGVTIYRNLYAGVPIRRRWNQVDGLLIWTSQRDDGHPIDVLTVVSGLDESFTSVESDQVGPARRSAPSAERTIEPSAHTPVPSESVDDIPRLSSSEQARLPDVMRASVRLDGCVLDLFDLRAALIGFGCEAPVVDQRLSP